MLERLKMHSMHIWMNGRRYDINHRRLEKPVANHFSLPDHSLEDLAIFVIEKIHSDGTHFRLGMLAPSRLNNDP